VGSDGNPVPQEGQQKIGDDVYQALSLLPAATIEGVGAGGVPSMIKGQLSRVQVNPATVTASDLGASLARIAPVFRVNAQNLSFQSAVTDKLAITHVRYGQLKNGLPVVGGELILHIDRTGVIYAANGSARDGVNLSATPTLDSAAAISVAQEARPLTGQSVGASRLVYVITSHDRSLHLAYEVPVMGRADGAPVRDLVYVDANSGQVVDRHATIETALNRKVYSANNGLNLPGSLKRTEGQAANSDAQVNYAYDNTGATYNCYQALFSRDSYDNAGATLISTVHYDQDYVNAYWDGTQMVYGDGDGTESLPLAEALDVTAHELTHAVTERSSNLVYQDEPGAMNESLSDIFGAICESWQRGGGDLAAGVTADTWKIGEVVWTPGTSGDALRYMNNPTLDDYSPDYYPERLTGSADEGGVHGNSGISNLAFYLISQGGHHPRNKTTVTVPGIGIVKAAQIFYRANTHYLTSNAQFADFRTATVQAATELYDQATADAVNLGWDAVGVPGGSGGGGGGGVTVLTNGTAVGNLSATTGNKLYFTLAVPSGATNLTFKTSGGSGDGDLYVKFGATPTSASYDCRPYISGNTETCSIANVQAGTYYVMINAYASFSGMSLTGSYSTSVPSNDFSISLGSSSASVTQGGTASVTVHTAVSSGSAQSVALSVSGLPSGVTGSFSPASVTAGGSATLTLTASASATTGVSTFTVKGTATSGSHTAAGSLTVNSSGGGGGSGVLTNGVPKTGLSGAANAQAVYTLTVPSGASGLSFKISGGTGDADLYVKFGSAPTLSSYDCRPYVSGNSETCSISNVQAGTYYVMINAYAAYSGVSLVGSYSTGGGGGGNVLVNGVPVTVSGASGSTQSFTFPVSSPSGSVTVKLSGGSGDADLYVKFGSAPTTTSYDCRPYVNGNNETCNLTGQSGTYYVMVRGYSSFSGTSLVGSY